VHEADEPDVLFDLFDADGLTGEDLAEIDLAHFEADAAARCDGDGPIVERIIERRQAFIAPRRGPVELGWEAHADGLMRALVVVAVDEVVEPLLLLQEVLSRRFGGLQLQGQVHALVASVLLGTPWFDALDRDAEPEPPHRELGEIEQRIGRSEGHAVISADGFGQAELLEDAFEGREGEGFLGGGERLTSEEITACEVGDGQGIAVTPIGEHELALVVGTPQLVRFEGLGKDRALRTMAPRLAALDQTMAIEHRMDGAFGGNPNIAIEPPDQQFADLARTPVRLLTLAADNQILDTAEVHIAFGGRLDLNDMNETTGAIDGRGSIEVAGV